MNILVLGATGFIGSVVARRLAANGHTVTGLGRSPERARNQLSTIEWLKADLSKLTQADDWTRFIHGQDAIVNCAGALQDGLHDDLVSTQQKAMLALYEAARRHDLRFLVQISASTKGAGADTAFLSTKRAADEALANSGIPYAILRPALAIGRNAFGGTALIRALAAFPGKTIPLVHADARVSTVSVDDVADCVARAIAGDIPSGSDIDLAASDAPTLRELVALHRAWLGLPPARTVALPAAFARPVAWCADMAGKLGWRSPFRSTAMTVMAGGVSPASPDANVSGLRLATAAETLETHPAGVQDVWFARLYLLKPLAIAVLSLFWLLSGLIPLLDIARATNFFTPFMPPLPATMVTLMTCALDIALGAAIVVRPWARRAMFGMLALSFTYLAAGTVLAPDLWLDPLGPFVKVLPSILLTIICLAILEER